MAIPLFVYLFISQSIFGFYFLAIMDNASMKFAYRFSVDMFSFLLGICLGVELLNHMAILCLTI